MPQHLAEFFPDLKDARMKASVAVLHQRGGSPMRNLDDRKPMLRAA